MRRPERLVILGSFFMGREPQLKIHIRIAVDYQAIEALHAKGAECDEHAHSYTKADRFESPRSI
jgi:hypothetical protein